MTDRDVLDVLERAVAELSPRHPDPVGAVLSRVRARRRRLVASITLTFVAVAGLGALGSQLGDGDIRSRTSPASDSGSDERSTARVTSDAVEVNGVTVPVPDGWGVEQLTEVRGDCQRPEAQLRPRMVYVMPDGHMGPAPCQSGVGITVSPGSELSRFGIGDLTIHDSGQPAWIEAEQVGGATSLILPWSRVVVSVHGTTRDEAITLLSEVGVSKRGPDGRPFVIDGKALSFGWSDFGAVHAGQESPDGGFTEDEQLIDQVVQLVEDGQPVDRLTCLPASDSVIVLDVASRDGRNDGSIAFDRTGACDIAFDDRGSAARINVPALMSLLKRAESPSYGSGSGGPGTG